MKSFLNILEDSDGHYWHCTRLLFLWTSQLELRGHCPQIRVSYSGLRFGEILLWNSPAKGLWLLSLSVYTGLSTFLTTKRLKQNGMCKLLSTNLFQTCEVKRCCCIHQGTGKNGPIHYNPNRRIVKRFGEVKRSSTHNRIFNSNPFYSHSI